MNNKSYLSWLGRVFNVCIFTFLIGSQAHAADCDLDDVNFPEDPNFTIEACSFNDLGINPATVKFGQVDAVFQVSSSNTIVRFGAASFNLPDSATLYHIEDNDDCDIGDGDDLDNISNVRDVAFIPSVTDPRIIARIWVLNCDIVQDR